MLKVAVIGAGTLLGREVVDTLETRDCSVLPLSTGAMSMDEELGDLVMFAPEASLLEDIQLVILADTPAAPEFLNDYKRRVLDLRAEPEASLEPMPLVGTWPEGKLALRGRPALEQVLATLPRLVAGLGEVSGTHLQSVAHLGDQGVDGLMEQTAAIFKGEDPKIDKLGYRAAFEVVPRVPRGRIIQVEVPAFHGDLLILHLRAAEGHVLSKLEAPLGVEWRETPATSREVAISPQLLAHFASSDEGRSAIVTLGYDPILWGVLMPLLRLLAL